MKRLSFAIMLALCTMGASLRPVNYLVSSYAGRGI